MCIDIVEICSGIANGQILSMFDRVICPQHDNGGYYSLAFLLVALCGAMTMFTLNIETP